MKKKTASGPTLFRPSLRLNSQKADPPKGGAEFNSGGFMNNNFRNGLFMFVIAMAVFASGAYAEGKCCGGGHGMHGKWGKGGDEGLDKKFFMKAHFIIENAGEIGLSADKVEAIKALKIETKKSMIRQDAEIEVAKIDIKSALYNYPIDVDAVNKLVDQKYELKKAKAKAAVAALAKLKGELSKDQYDKLVTLWKDKESRHGK